MRLSRFIESLAYRNLRRFGVAHTWNFAAVPDILPSEQRGASRCKIKAPYPTAVCRSHQLIINQASKPSIINFHQKKHARDNLELDERVIDSKLGVSRHFERSRT